jgi:hypothetical protein
MRVIFVKALMVMAIWGAAGVMAESVEWNVSGDRGGDGYRGGDGSSGFGGFFGGRGGDGGRGQRGGDAERGHDAGRIDVRLFTPNAQEKGILRIEGTIVNPMGTAQEVQRDLVGNQSSIQLSAEGGDGGNGGGGGDGGHGGSGGHGADATRYSSGSNGGNGGDGGDGGPGGYGGGGGNGGTINVNVKNAESHWLMLLDRFDIVAGRGGAGGNGGSGGSGGSGGWGGSSYSWSETESYTDSDGKRQSRSVSHWNSGGMSGWSGSSGSSGPRGDSGRSGTDGQFAITVNYEDGRTAVYRERYDIRITQYQMLDHNRDGRFEPGEEVEVHNLTIQNTGGMPTPPPPNSFVRVALDGDARLSFEPLYLELPRVLNPGESYTFADQVLPFHIADVAASEIPAVGQPFRVAQELRPHAVLTTVDREFVNGRNPTTFTVEFPVEIKPIRALPALAQGESTTVYFEVKNISSKALGSASDVQRALSLTLFGHGEGAEPFKVGYIDEDGKSKALTAAEMPPLLKAIEYLPPGGSRVVKGTLTAPTGVEAQTVYHIGAQLGLGRAEKGDELRAIHTRMHRLVIVDAYEKNPQADILLITNGSSTKEEVRAWRDQFRRMGLVCSTWNLSYYGFLDLAQEVSANHHRLLDDFQGKTIVFLNYPFESDANHVVAARLHLAKDAFLKAINNRGINFLVVGETQNDQGEDLISNLVMPTNEYADLNYRSIEEFKSRHWSEQGKDTYGRGPGVIGRTMVSPFVFHINVTQKFYWSQATEENLKTEAETLQKDFLQYWYPNRRYAVTWNYRPQTLKKGGHFSSDVISLGEILVRQIPDAPENVAMSLAVDSVGRARPETIESLSTRQAVISSLSFAHKVKRFDQVMQTLSTHYDAELVAQGQMLVDAMLADISYEQRSALMGWFRYDTGKRMRNLETLSTYPFAAKVPGGSEAEKLVARLVAGVYLMADHSYVWFWSKLTVVRVTNGRTTRAFNYHYVDTFRDRVLRVPSGYAGFTKQVDARWYQLRDLAYANAKAANQWRNESVRQLLETPLRRSGVTAATNVWANETERVLKPETYQALQAADLQLERQRQAIEAENRASQAELMGTPRH